MATANFAEQQNVLVYLAGAGLIGMAILFPFAAELGKRNSAIGSQPPSRRSPPTGTRSAPRGHA